MIFNISQAIYEIVFARYYETKDSIRVGQQNKTYQNPPTLITNPVRKILSENYLIKIKLIFIEEL